MILLARLLIIADILLSTVYFVSYKVNFMRVLEVVLVLFVLVLGLGKRRLRPSTVSLMKWSFGLILFKFLLDSTLHFDNSFESINALLIESFAVLMLPVFERIGAERISPILTVVIIALPAMLFGAVQIFDPTFTLQRLIPQNSFLIFEQTHARYIQETSRIVGTYNIAIGFALLLGMVSLILWVEGIVYGSLKVKVLSAVLLVASAVLIVFTQTRSAIYGLVPSLLLAYLITSPRILRKTSIAVGSLVAITIGFAGFQAFVLTYSERSAIELDPSTYYKITANIYGTYAALSRNPLIGVPVNRDLDRTGATRKDMELIQEGYRQLGNVIKSKETYRLTPTNHNLYAYYLKYYGLIGFFLLGMVIFKAYKKIMLKTHLSDRFLLLALFLYYLQYSLLHNTQLFETLLLWLILSHGEEHERNISSHVGVQRGSNVAVDHR